MLNWRPVVDYELREIEFDRREIEHEQRMKQLKSENERLAELNAKLSAILCSCATNSNPTHPRGARLHHAHHQASASGHSGCPMLLTVQYPYIIGLV